MAHTPHTSTLCNMWRCNEFYLPRVIFYGCELLPRVLVINGHHSLAAIDKKGIVFISVAHVPNQTGNVTSCLSIDTHTQQMQHIHDIVQNKLLKVEAASTQQHPCTCVEFVGHLQVRVSWMQFRTVLLLIGFPFHPVRRFPFHRFAPHFTPISAQHCSP